ncbi:hypothetical protein TIFTF001_050047 [Ficus carica]|uniref:Extradiol ring-cleavage dioxygenase class III enzyme subunit B domain-containing protein n=1 Tax=Ficus carica TaxID=3494 RepID=A0AA87YWE3_FICCA|nr:hypothetical protein TIFTF001_050044 [Ficus carica]GMN20539.1 hypothetical protein TIFTF001_050047 [Ficus carica]
MEKKVRLRLANSREGGDQRGEEGGAGFWGCVWRTKKKVVGLKYPAPGAPQLAKRVKELLVESGLDHGAWVPLMLMYPEAQIPVCQLSVQTQRDATYHNNLGRALAPLKDEGVLIIGSGSATHNLRAVRLTDGSLVPWAVDFDNWLRHALEERR